MVRRLSILSLVIIVLGGCQKSDSSSPAQPHKTGGVDVGAGPGAGSGSAQAKTPPAVVSLGRSVPLPEIFKSKSPPITVFPKEPASLSRDEQELLRATNEIRAR